MENNLDQKVKEECCKIYFPDHTFGKATKSRREDPSMYEILSWGADGFQKHCFKRDQKFEQPNEAYLNMIGRSPWKSESQQNFVNYYDNCIEVNPSTFHKIQDYIENHEPQSCKIVKKQCSKNERKQKNIVTSMQEGKQQNKRQVNNYSSQKHVSNKNVTKGPASNQHLNKSQSGQAFKQTKKAKKHEQQRYQSEHKNIAQKSYGKSLEKDKLDNQEMSQDDKQKLIKKFKQTTRWIPNSSFTTYFGQPPFQNYGRGNTHPTDGGLIYGTYLYSHNVHPHRGNNHPKNLQSYPIALMKAKSQGMLRPTYPRTKPDYSKQPSKMNVGDNDHRSKIEPSTNYFSGELGISVPHLEEMQKFGGKPNKRVLTEVPAG